MKYRVKYDDPTEEEAVYIVTGYSHPVVGPKKRAKVFYTAADALEAAAAHSRFYKGLRTFAGLEEVEEEPTGLKTEPKKL